MSDQSGRDGAKESKKQYGICESMGVDVCGDMKRAMFFYVCGRINVDIERKDGRGRCKRLSDRQLAGGGGLRKLVWS